MPTAEGMRARVAGVDEAGRGPLAGPVVAAAVILHPRRRIRGLADSKVLSAQERARLAPIIRARALAWAIGWADRDEIDCLNILEATLLAMRRALLALPVCPTHVRVDGNRCPCICGCTPSTPSATAWCGCRSSSRRWPPRACRRWR